jgi:hypothetical protein
MQFLRRVCVRSKKRPQLRDAWCSANVCWVSWLVALCFLTIEFRRTGWCNQKTVCVTRTVLQAIKLLFSKCLSTHAGVRDGAREQKGWSSFKKLFQSSKTILLGCHETSGAYYRATECHIPEWRRPQLHRCVNPKIRKTFVHRQPFIVTTSFMSQSIMYRCLGLLYSEYGGITLLRNVGNHLPPHTALCPRRLKF